MSYTNIVTRKPSTILYKTVKNYKALENHWIKGQVSFIETSIDRNVLIQFLPPQSDNFLCVYGQFLPLKVFFQQELVFYDKKLKQLSFNKNLKFWWSEEYFNFGVPLRFIWMHQNFLSRELKQQRKFFRVIEKKNFYLLLKKKRQIFLDKRIKKKLYNFKYGNTVLRTLLKNFIRKCAFNLFFRAKKENKKLLGFIYKISWGGFRLYFPGIPLTIFMPISHIGVQKWYSNFNILLKFLKRRRVLTQMTFKIVNNNLKSNVAFKHSLSIIVSFKENSL